MRRMLFALLAILAGLLTQANPAFARMSSSNDAEFGVVDTLRPGARPSPVLPSAIAAPAVRQEQRTRIANRSRPLRAPIFIPAVLFGADRAFE